MASMSSFERWTVNRLQIVSKSTAKQKQEPSKLFLLPVPTSRRCAILISALPLGLILLPPLSEARERRNKKAIPLEDYLTTLVSEQAPDDPNHAKRPNGIGVGRVPMATRVLLESGGRECQASMGQR
ncbi:hypothetical protein GH714_007582 [Hevea brasiliensis]|uniref:Uncharacterized protein n=1 Tax=Hevea brasiliensis TaxID=3981 RepID=A0A6A6MAI2_HEVBR|nr:hypothetical protein GH714_007582 [Hevea brasiliensis]